MPIAHLYFVVSAFLLALGAVLSKILLSSGVGDNAPPSPIAILALQLFGGIVFLMFMCVLRGRRRTSLSQWKRPAWAGAILGVGSIGTICALDLISASEASLVFATQPVVVLGLAWLLLKERVSTAVILLCLGAVAGVTLTIAGEASTTAPGRAAGLSFAALSTFCAALYTVWMRGLNATQDLPTALIVVQCVACLIALSGLGTAWFVNAAGVSAGDLPTIFGAIASGGIYYGAAFYIYLVGLKTTQASTAGVYLSLVPVFTIAMAHAVLGETLSALQWVGAGIVITAVSAVFILSRARG